MKLSYKIIKELFLKNILRKTENAYTMKKLSRLNEKFNTFKRLHLIYHIYFDLLFVFLRQLFTL